MVPEQGKLSQQRVEVLRSRHGYWYHWQLTSCKSSQLVAYFAQVHLVATLSLSPGV